MYKGERHALHKLMSIWYACVHIAHSSMMIKLQSGLATSLYLTPIIPRILIYDNNDFLMELFRYWKSLFDILTFAYMISWMFNTPNKVQLKFLEIYSPNIKKKLLISK